MHKIYTKKQYLLAKYSKNMLKFTRKVIKNYAYCDNRCSFLSFLCSRKYSAYGRLAYREAEISTHTKRTSFLQLVKLYLHLCKCIISNLFEIARLFYVVGNIAKLQIYLQYFSDMLRPYQRTIAFVFNKSEFVKTNT